MTLLQLTAALVPPCRSSPLGTHLEVNTGKEQQDRAIPSIEENRCPLTMTTACEEHLENPMQTRQERAEAERPASCLTLHCVPAGFGLIGDHHCCPRFLALAPFLTSGYASPGHMETISPRVFNLPGYLCSSSPRTCQPGGCCLSDPSGNELIQPVPWDLNA